MSAAPKSRLWAKHTPLVFIVDDDQSIADTLSKLLIWEGFDTAVAYSGADALELAQLVEPDILISDIMMPGMDGYQLAAEMRRRHPDCSVILNSGNPDTLNREFEVLQKPVPFARLLSIIRSNNKKPVSSLPPSDFRLDKQTS